MATRSTRSRAEWDAAVDRSAPVDDPSRLTQANVIGIVNEVERPARRRRLRRRRPAGRSAQALAAGRSQGLPPRVRLLLHGLRDRRRSRREDGRARPRGLRDGRRRQLPDAPHRDRDLDPGGPEADHRPARQRRLPAASADCRWPTARRRSATSSATGTRAGDACGPTVPIDFAKNAESLGALAIKASNAQELRDALQKARQQYNLRSNRT